MPDHLEAGCVNVLRTHPIRHGLAGCGGEQRRGPVTDMRCVLGDEDDGPVGVVEGPAGDRTEAVDEAVGDGRVVGGVLEA